MKTLFIILIMIFLTGFIFSLDIHGHLETGYITRGNVKAMCEKYLDFNNTFFIDFKIYTTLFIDIGGNVKTYFFIEYEKIQCMPFFMEYTFFVRKQFDNIEIGFLHICSHSINLSGFISNVDMGEEKIYIKLKF